MGVVQIEGLDLAPASCRNRGPGARYGDLQQMAMEGVDEASSKWSRSCCSRESQSVQHGFRVLRFGRLDGLGTVGQLRVSLTAELSLVLFPFGLLTAATASSCSSSCRRCLESEVATKTGMWKTVSSQNPDPVRRARGKRVIPEVQEMKVKKKG